MKTIKEMIAVMQAYADGKTIECYGYSYLNNWTEVENPKWDWWNYDYRVKQEPKYRPYKDAAECFKEVQKHQWWIILEQNQYRLITGIGDRYNTDRVKLSRDNWITFEELTDAVWADDGTRCGVLEE